MLGEDVDLHVAVDAVFGFGVDADAQAGVEDQGVEAGEVGGEALGDSVDVVEVFELDLDGLDAGEVAVLLQAFFRRGDVLGFLAEEVELLAVVLEQVRADAEAWISR